MNIIITGGTGLIGRALTDDLSADGHNVTILTRDPERVAGLPPGVEAVKWDARTGAGWIDRAEAAHAIVNLAGAGIAGDGLLPTRWTPARKRIILESRLNAGRAVMDAIEKTSVKPGCLIQASGIGYYGTVDDRIYDENAPAGDDFLARVAAEWEAITEPAAALGVRRAIIRSGGVLSGAGGLLALSTLPFRFFLGGRIGSGQQAVPWIHIADEVAAIRHLIEHDTASGPFNLVAPQQITNREFTAAIGRAMGRPAALWVPGFAMRLALGELATLLLDGQRAVPARLNEIGFVFRFTDINVALSAVLG
jgi:uncharacterized protein